MTLVQIPKLNITPQIILQPTITATSYSAGQQLGGILTIPNIVRQSQNYALASAELRNINILDSDNQKAAIDFWFFNQSPTITSVDHGTFAMTKANFQAQCIGAVSVGTSYSSNGTLAVSSDAKPTSLILEIPNTNLQSAANANSNNIYAVAICQGTPTYASTSSLIFQFAFYED